MQGTNTVHMHLTVCNDSMQARVRQHWDGAPQGASRGLPHVSSVFPSSLTWRQLTQCQCRALRKYCTSQCSNPLLSAAKACFDRFNLRARTRARHALTRTRRQTEAPAGMGLPKFRPFGHRSFRRNISLKPRSCLRLPPEKSVGADGVSAHPWPVHGAHGADRSSGPAMAHACPGSGCWPSAGPSRVDRSVRCLHPSFR